jgi:hypothetical protein
MKDRLEICEKDWQRCKFRDAMLRWLTERAGYRPETRDLAGRITERRLRLFGVAVWRTVSALQGRKWEHQVTVPYTAWDAADLAEKIADGLATQAPCTSSLWVHREPAIEAAKNAVLVGEYHEIIRSDMGVPLSWCIHDIFGYDWQPVLFRDLGQPDCPRCLGTGSAYEPVTLRPCPACSKITPLITALATQAYETRELPQGYLDTTCLSILADALEDGGLPEEPCPECAGTGEFTQEHPFGDTFVEEVLSCHCCEGRGKIPHRLVRHLRDHRHHVRGCWAVDLCMGRE